MGGDCTGFSSGSTTMVRSGSPICIILLPPPRLASLLGSCVVSKHERRRCFASGQSHGPSRPAESRRLQRDSHCATHRGGSCPAGRDEGSLPGSPHRDCSTAGNSPCRSGLRQDFPTDDVRRVNSPVALTDGDVVASPDYPVVQRVGGDAVTVICQASADLPCQFTLIVESLHLTPPLSCAP